jgi:hypothetical protein
MENKTADQIYGDLLQVNSYFELMTVKVKNAELSLVDKLEGLEERYSLMRRLDALGVEYCLCENKMEVKMSNAKSNVTITVHYAK